MNREESQEVNFDEIFQSGGDLLPNDGTYYHLQEPEAQIKSNQAEKAKTTAAKPLLRDLIKRLENRINYYDSTQSIDEKYVTDKAKFQISYLANRQTANNLREELAYYHSLLDDQ